MLRNPLPVACRRWLRSAANGGESLDVGFQFPHMRRDMARTMSRHISGELPAIREKSRKPPAAKAEQLLGIGRRGISSTRANASTVGQVLTAAKNLIVGFRDMALTLAPQPRQKASVPMTASASFSGKLGQYHVLLVIEQFGFRGLHTALFRADAMDVRARSCRQPVTRCARAAANDVPLVLPASVTMAWAGRWGVRCNADAFRHLPTTHRRADAVAFLLASPGVARQHR